MPAWGRPKGRDAKRNEKTSGEEGIAEDAEFTLLVVVMVSWVQFILCRLHLNKPVKIRHTPTFNDFSTLFISWSNKLLKFCSPPENIWYFFTDLEKI